jgi:Ala-tRNA(Pro) deacylase
MALSPTLQKFLADNGIDYDVIQHERTMTAARAAQTSHVSGDCVAKGVVLQDGAGYLMAVLPSSHHLELDELSGQLERPLGLAGERDVEALFPDCDRGAVPPVGRAYGVDVIVDDSLAAQRDLYFEGGDHASLVHVDRTAFDRLMGGARHGRFSRRD